MFPLDTTFYMKYTKEIQKNPKEILGQCILVSKEALGPQECSPTSQNVSNIVLMGKKWKIHSHNISFVFFGISFVYFI